MGLQKVRIEEGKIHYQEKEEERLVCAVSADKRGAGGGGRSLHDSPLPQRID